MFRTLIFATAIASFALAGAAQAEDMTAKAMLKGPDGKDVGAVDLLETPNGVLLTVKLKNISAGDHAFHIHETGKCEAPFKTAGGHYNPGESKHGILEEDGMHAGDMPNVHVPESGALTFEVLNTNVTLEKDDPNTLFDEDGSAIVMHEGPDDYKSQPSGSAGGRIACGVIE